MEIRRVLPYILGLVFLAFALGSLPRSQVGGSLLFQSYWLLYLFYLAPIAVLGIMAALVVLIVRNWRELSEGIGHGMARGRRKKPRSMMSLLVYISVWALAIVVILSRQSNLHAPLNSTVVMHEVNGNQASIPNPFQNGNSIGPISSFVQAEWFNFMFIGLAVVCGLVLVASLRVSMREKSEPDTLYPNKQEEGLQAVEQAMKVVHDSKTDPRSRIIACYEQLIAAAFRLGAPISSDQTARELEEEIRSMFRLKGNGIHELTNLFEEARYSLHDIIEDDASRAMDELQSIYGELDSQNDIEP